VLHEVARRRLGPCVREMLQVDDLVDIQGEGSGALFSAADVIIVWVGGGITGRCSAAGWYGNESWRGGVGAALW